jgi:hypothetical protein
MKKSVIPDNQRYVYLVACYDDLNQIKGYACTRPYWASPTTLSECKVYLLRNGAQARANRLNKNAWQIGTWVAVPQLINVTEPSPKLPTRYMLRHDHGGNRYLVPVVHDYDWQQFMAIPEDDPLSWTVPGFAQLVEGNLTFEKPEFK